MSPIVAGATSLEMAAEAKAGGANALLAFPRADDPVAYHEALGRELPVIAFYLYEAAGGVAYDNQTLHAILALPNVIGIKVATLDSVVTFQRIAGLMRDHPDKLLITGEDRFLGYSLTMGARAALIGMGAAREMMLLGETWDAARAHRQGLVNRVVDAGSALDAAVALAEQIAGFPWRCVVSDRKAVLEGLGRSLEEGLALEDRLGQEVIFDPGFSAGVERFAVRRRTP